jgi:SAM-dependent methyltransferase
MTRRFIGFSGVFLSFVFLSSTLPGQQAGKKGLTLKVLLPQFDAKLTIDGTTIRGKGEERTVKAQVDASKDSIVVSAFWEPNNYTKITRKRKVSTKEEMATVDLRKQDLKEPDDIVVRYVPTPQDVTDAMCRLAKVTKDDVVYDLGCGDGRMVITAVQKFGAKRGVGVDLDPDRVKDSKENAKKAKVEDKVEFRVGDVLKVSDLSDATVVLLYMGDDINLRLRPILQQTLKPGARIVSHRFTMGDWKAEKEETVNSSEGYECRILLWTIKGKK